jgi:hypothetical protein
MGMYCVSVVVETHRNKGTGVVGADDDDGDERIKSSLSFSL